MKGHRELGRYLAAKWWPRGLGPRRSITGNLGKGLTIPVGVGWHSTYAGKGEANKKWQAGRLKLEDDRIREQHLRKSGLKSITSEDSIEPHL